MKSSVSESKTNNNKRLSKNPTIAQPSLLEQPRFPDESSRTQPIETCTHLFVPLRSTRKDSKPPVLLRRSESFSSKRKATE